MLSVKGKVVVVTGANRGIGQAIAKTFWDHGAKVVCTLRQWDDAKLWMADDERSCIVEIDITDPGAPDKICEAAVDAFGRMDVLVNNAGRTYRGKDHFDEDAWSTLIPNLIAPANISNAFSKINSSGVIINIASIAAFAGVPNPTYAAAKAGLVGLTRSMAQVYPEMRINSLGVGYIHTDERGMTAKSYETRRDQVSESTILGRWGTGEEVAGACMFLASDASSYITGQCIMVDGGYSVKAV